MGSNRLRPQFRISVRLRLVAVAAAIQAIELAGVAFAQAILLYRERHVVRLDKIPELFRKDVVVA